MIWFALAVALAAPAAAQSDTYTQTRYPIVLLHGMFGFDTIGPLEYWYGIPGALRAGGATVYVPQVSTANSSAVRGEQLLAELQRLQALHGHEKFNLIGHSQGGQTIRYVAAVAPDLVASVSSVGTPHTGSPVAEDMLAGGDPGWTSAVIKAIARLIGLLSGSPQAPVDIDAALHDLSFSGSAAFNATFPDGAPAEPCGAGPELVGGVRYFSAGGTKVSTNVLDLSDPLLRLTAQSFDGAPNDGLVGRCASHWGSVLRDDYGWNHLDEVNLLFGLRGLFAPDPVAFYRSHANRLKLLGL